MACSGVRAPKQEGVDGEAGTLPCSTLPLFLAGAPPTAAGFQLLKSPKVEEKGPPVPILMSQPASGAPL